MLSTSWDVYQGLLLHLFALTPLTNLYFLVYPPHFRFNAL